MRKYTLYAVIVLITLTIDQWSKHWVIEHLIPFHGGITVTSWFNIVLAKNPGAAFSLLANAGGWQRYFFTLIAIAAILWITLLILRHQRDRLFSGALSLILGGALGNLIDRLKDGVVTDFIQWHIGEHYWPSFNVADSAITVGAVLLIVHSLLKKHD